jgi:hypothetical protein
VAGSIPAAVAEGARREEDTHELAAVEPAAAAAAAAGMPGQPAVGCKPGQLAAVVVLVDVVVDIPGQWAGYVVGGS